VNDRAVKVEGEDKVKEPKELTGPKGQFSNVDDCVLKGKGEVKEPKEPEEKGTKGTKSGR
jgi:hypothetical protein